MYNCKEILLHKKIFNIPIESIVLAKNEIKFHEYVQKLKLEFTYFKTTVYI